MFERAKLYKAIVAEDHDTIRALVARKGAGLLACGLPVTIKHKELRAGASLIDEVFRRPYALPLAMRVADRATIDLLIELGAPFNQGGNKNYPTMLFVAVALGHVELVREWLDTRLSRGVLVANQDGDSLLHIACLHGQSDITRLLLSRGFYTARRNRSGETTFMLAQQANDDASYGLLMEASHGRLPQVAPPRAEATAPETITPPAGQGGAPQAVWKCLDDARVARVTTAENIGYRLTDVFNFDTREVLRLSHNLATGQESAVVTPFADFAEVAALNEAARRRDPAALPMAAPRVVIRKRD